MPGLDGKRAIVTRAARGIGRATADHLTSLGCRVAICDMDATALADIGGLYGYPLRTPYASAKWALIGLTKSLASEAGPQGVRVNAIAPGTPDGKRMDGVIAREATARGVSEAEVRDRYIQQSGMRTLIDAQDITDTIGFLCSDAAKRMNGQVLSVDGHTEVL